MTDHSCNIIIIGAGIVGSAVARTLSERFDGIILLEKEPFPGLHTSGRNSGVVHSGFNQHVGTLKARLCVEGNAMIRRYSQEKGIPFEPVGTCVVATEEQQIPVLKTLKQRGEQNGVPGLALLSPEELQEQEPNALGYAALFSPTGAIVDSKALTGRLVQDAQEGGVSFHASQEVRDLTEIHGGIRIQTQQDTYTGKLLINCSGLQADRLAHRMGVGLDYTIAPFRGEYFVVQRPIVRSMVYAPPYPKLPFLGIHLTKSTAGSVLVGPNAVPAFGREAYRKNSVCFKDMAEMIGHRGFRHALLKNRALVRIGCHELMHSLSKTHFLKEASRLVKGLSLRDMDTTTHVGIRPQLISPDGQLVDDLLIKTTPHSIHILNMVSPGMTCSMAFARWLSENIDDQMLWSGAQVSDFSEDN